MRNGPRLPGGVIYQKFPVPGRTVLSMAGSHLGSVTF